ncbi:DMT family transporter [Bacillus sp. FJAT-47783]|uniref:DMT family transporter n=1 Tax=Bacillus sp. FJAT-47783 TaxID=2922712 RepID=UPI001FADB820|nr:DMT family transporter [Bacillus sp. FJAT-47783]
MSKALLYLLMLGIMMLWGFNVIAIKVIVEVFDPVTITAFRIFIAGLVVMMMVMVAKEMRKMTKMEWIYISIASVTGVLGHHLFLAVGLSYTTASNAGLILGLVPLMTTLFAALFLKDRLTLSKILGISLGFLGVSFIILNGNNEVARVSKGDLFIFLSVVAQAISFIFIKKGTATLHSRLMTGWMLLIGSIALFITSIIMEPNGFQTLQKGTIPVWAIFLASAVLATAIGHSMYNRAIYHLGPGETALFINLTPFFSLIGSYLFLGEHISSLQLIGFVFIIFGVLLGTGTIGAHWLSVHSIKKRQNKAI